ncbi:MAG TPA: methylenetetrahydrofolate reductase [NAD(P)H] [Bacteroidales bacterium]|nr:methylenetetrahydrofolate reductase [NAD(P)H] [Bacteroidales bacterium]HPS17898.1 methylenetetrahydrofolate reductase [NAD(P)H] [Bacteroidales bacterium]
MKVSEYIRCSNKPYITFEILPPLKGKSIESLYGILDPLMDFKPPFINVTYHSSEYTYKERPNGYLEKVLIRKRPGTVGICASIMFRYKVDAVAHLICGGFSRHETEDALIDLHYLGVKNILVLRGDPPKTERDFTPEPNGNKHSVELLRQIVNINNGIYLEEDLKDGFKTDFCMGVAGYPEKHFEAPNLSADLNFLKNKVDAGAEYIVTQMFFDNRKYFDFVNQCRSKGINVPIIPGIKPITTKNQVSKIPSTFHVDIPEDLYNAIEKCKNDADAAKVGIEWAIQQGKELLKNGAPCLHFFTMSNPKPIVEIAKVLF